MSELTNRIDTLLTENHLKRVDLVRGTGIQESAIRKWIAGSVPNVEYALKVAKYLGVTVEWLVTGENTESENSIVVSEQERELINVFRHLDERDKTTVISLANTLEQQYCTGTEKKLGSG